MNDSAKHELATAILETLRAREASYKGDFRYGLVHGRGEGVRGP